MHLERLSEWFTLWENYFYAQILEIQKYSCNLQSYAGGLSVFGHVDICYGRGSNIRGYAKFVAVVSKRPSRIGASDPGYGKSRAEVFP